MMKQRLNQGKNPNLFFWRDNTGHEIDVIIEKGNNLFPVEIKSGKTITTEFFKGLTKWQKFSGTENSAVIYAGDEYQKRSNGVEILPWRDYHSALEL